MLEDGGQTRDFVHVRDVARANVAALTRREPVDGPLNVASGTPRTVLDLARGAVRGDRAWHPRSWAAAGSATSATSSPAADRAAARLGFRGDRAVRLGPALAG